MPLLFDIEQMQDLGVHKSHQLDYVPCLHLECVYCMCSPKNNLDELKDPCMGAQYLTNKEPVLVKMKEE